MSEDRLLASAELRGCLVKVLRARDTRHVGVQGIVAALTKNVVCVVDASDNLHGETRRGLCMLLGWERGAGWWLVAVRMACYDPIWWMQLASLG